MLKKRLFKNDFSFLNLTEELGNITEVCLKMGVSRNLFNVYKKRHKEHNTDGLKVSGAEKSKNPMGTSAIVEPLNVEEDVRYAFLAKSNQHLTL